MTNDLNHGDNLDLAAYIDQDQQVERMATFSQQSQPISSEVVLDEVVVDGPTLLPTQRDRVVAMLHEEGSQRVEDGKLFHGKIKSWKMKKNVNGNPYVHFEVVLTCNGWRLSHYRYLPDSQISTTEAIAAARDAILEEYGYDPESKTDPAKPAFPETKLFLIADWKSKDDGKVHHKVGKVFKDTADYNGYAQWKWNQDHAPKKQRKVYSADLPED